MQNEFIKYNIVNLCNKMFLFQNKEITWKWKVPMYGYHKNRNKKRSLDKIHKYSARAYRNITDTF